MEIHEQPCQIEGVRLLALDGGLDQTNTDDFVRKMDDCLASGTLRVVLDLKHLVFVSSWGLGALVRVHHHCASRGGRLAFANLHSTVATALKMSRLDRLFDLYPTVERAIEGVTRSGGKADH
jgi:anti-sigma B factor antagonist